MRLSVSKDILRIIRKIAALAEDRGYKAYLVGGFVRDLLLGVKNFDIDIAVEGDALKLAKYASAKLNAALVVYRKFGTATLIIPESPESAKIKIDIATARKESYKHPAALPAVEAGSIKDDLYRRDFTINAMAISINKKNFGEVIDFFDGAKDLAMKRIRVLHEGSFIDDPTRIFRAVRFEQRYGFKIDDRTARLIRNAVKAEMFERVSGERLRTEIELLLKEKEPLRAVKRMRSLDELKFISPGIRFGGTEAALLKSIKKATALYGKHFSGKYTFDLWLVYFMAMIDKLTLNDALKVCDRLVMKRSDKMSVISAKKHGKKIIALLSDKKDVRPSKIYGVLKPLSCETLLFIAAKCRGSFARRRIGRFLVKDRVVQLLIKGADLKSLGAQPGPCFTAILKKTLYAKIDGLISTKQDELLFAKKQITHETEIS